MSIIHHVRDTLWFWWFFWTHSDWGVRINGRFGPCGDWSLWIGRWNQGWIKGLLTGLEIHFEPVPEHFDMPGYSEPTRVYYRFFGIKRRLF